MERKYNYVYKLTFKLDPRFYYIGKHSTDRLNDNYLGSGRGLRSYKEKYGKDCFSKEILENFSTEQEALHREAELVTETQLLDPFCLNRIVGGGNNCAGTVIVKKKGEEKAFRCSLWDEKYLSGEYVSVVTGKHPSEKTRALWSLHRKGRPAWNKGKHSSEETREKLRKANLGRPMKESTRKKIIESDLGRKAIHRGAERKRVKSDQLEKFLQEGWQLGQGLVMKKINKDGKEKYVREECLQKYLNEGWKLGSLPKSIETRKKMSKSSQKRWDKFHGKI